MGNLMWAVGTELEGRVGVKKRKEEGRGKEEVFRK